MINVNRKLFSRALDLAATTVITRGSIPILANLKVTANGALRLEGTDLDNWSCVELAYEGETGSFTLPQPRMVRTAMNTAGGDVVELGQGEEDTVAVRSGRLNSSLKALPVADFPTPDRIGFEDFSATIGATEFKQIARVMAAISNEETRYYLNGVCVRKIGDWMYQFAATDGHRLMVVDVPLPDAAGVLPDNIIIPRQWLNIVMARLSKAKAGAKLTYGRNAISNAEGPDFPLQSGGPRIALRGELEGITFSVTGKLIDGTYPDYTRIVPTSLNYAALMRRGDLAQAVHTLSALTFSKYRSVKLTFSPDKVKVELISPDLGQSVFDIEAQHDLPGDLVIGLNGNYLLRMLEALSGDEVVLNIDDSAAPVLVIDPADTAFKGVLMPVRV
jgi:DNA polymerase-3 subunit beta